MLLTTPIEQITSIGKKISPALKKLGLATAQDLLFYWPFRYEDWSRVKPISEIHAGEAISTKGTLDLIQNKRGRFAKRMVTEGIISDETGSIRAVWFHQPYLTRNLKPGDTVFLSGKVENGQSGLQFVHPNYEKVTTRKNDPTHTARIIPMYSLTKRVTQKQLRYLISQVIQLSQEIPEWVPTDLLRQYNLQPLSSAIKQIHFPDNHESLYQAQHRLKYNELLLIQLRAQIAKHDLEQTKAPVIYFNEQETQTYVQGLPFTLTNAQRKASWEIIQDLEKPQPMNRLLEGDVGSGKTVVASLGIINTLFNEYQVAYLAPTEILARQQYQTYQKLFSKQGITTGLLTGSQALYNQEPTPKSKLKKLISEGEVSLVVGTHALIQDSVQFNKLGLAIVDEQHRFGVDQRAALTKYSPQPHFLSMTATPIPRSLALTLYGDLDLSIIDELPPGRQPIETTLIPPEKRGEYYSFIKNEVGKGRQIFVICPLVDPSDKLGKKAATEEYEKLKHHIFPDLRIGLVHGRLKPKDKESEMTKFYNHEYDILVATPVIEVGIDVPNASVIMIEAAERFGLAQLHQFRGRVGRGKHQSYCFLFTDTESTDSLNRLQALVESQDGFSLAERDLEFRGPGEVYGVRQHGFDDVLKIAKLTDYQIIKEAQASALALLNYSADLTKTPLLKKHLDAFSLSIHLE